MCINTEMQRHANSIARKNGYAKATQVVAGDNDCVLYRIDPGYRKKTTHEYVPNAYRNKFGWKNTYYQSAETIVMVNVRW
jgi:diaminopimelate decarboxylase